MFGGLRLASFKQESNAYTLTLGFGHAANSKPESLDAPPTPSPSKSISVSWLSTDTEDEVVDKITNALKDPSVRSERVVVNLGGLAAGGGKGLFGGIINAASYNHEIQLNLKIQDSDPILTSIELVKTAGFGALSTSLGGAVWKALSNHLTHVVYLRCEDGIASLWDEALLAKFSDLKILDLSNSGLVTLSGSIKTLSKLEELWMNNNKLKALPPEVGRLLNLKVLAANNNELVILRGELRNCTGLEKLLLAFNKLDKVLIDFSQFRGLKVLELHGNPLEILPEIHSCLQLEKLSVANLIVSSRNASYTKFDVEILPLAAAGATINIPLFDTSKPIDKMTPVIGLVLKSSAGHHPLLAGSLRYLMEDAKNRDSLSQQIKALQQLILMALDDNPIVATQTCMALTLLAQHNPTTAKALVDADLNQIYSLLHSEDAELQISALKILGALATTAPKLSPKILDNALLKEVEKLASSKEVSSEVQIMALITIGNFAFDNAVKRLLVRQHSFMQIVRQFAKLPPAGSVPTVPRRVRIAAVRVLAILGENESVDKAVGKPPIVGRGVRVLSLDGGGMKGMATVQMLRQIEARTGRRIYELFDLIVGTSTGGLLAVALGLNHMSMDECEAVYKVLGQKVFSRPYNSASKEESGWMDSIYRGFQSKTQHVRAVVVGCKHDSAAYEVLLKEYCDMTKNGRCLVDTMIDTATLPNAPKIGVVSTLASSAPAVPFVFRNYELPVGSDQLKGSLKMHQGSSRHAVWQAVRASSAAIYYLDDYTCGNDKFQDGAVTANNPSVVALQEARLLWPDRPIDVFLSLGTGSTPTGVRNKGMSSYMDTGNILLESATGVHRIEEAMAVFSSLMPDVHYYRLNPLDARCAMELDEIDPAVWARLEAATEDYLKANERELDIISNALTSGLSSGKNAAADPRHMRLGHQRGLLVVKACNTMGALDEEVADTLEKLPMCIGMVNLDTSPAHSESDQAANTAAALANADNDSNVIDAVVEPMSPGVDIVKAKTSHMPSRSASAAVPVTAAPAKTQNSNATVEVDIGSISSFFTSWFSPSKVLPPESKLAEPEKATEGEPVEEASFEQHDSQPPSSVTSPLASPMANNPAMSTPKRGIHGSGTEGGLSSHKIAQLQQELSPKELLQAKLAEFKRDIGTLHLGLASTVPGLVIACESSTEAILEPSPEALQLLEEAGSSSLAQLFGNNKFTVSLPNGDVLELVSKQTHRIKRNEECSVYLVQRTTPSVVLDAAFVNDLGLALKGYLVCSASVIPAEVISAMLNNGAKAVVCPRVPVPSSSSGVVGEFFSGFYSVLYKGASVADALARAESLVPNLQSVFAVHAA